MRKELIGKVAPSTDITSCNYSITQDNIQPILLLPEEVALMNVNTRIEYDEYNNAVAFIDPWCEGGGWILEKDDLTSINSLYNLAISNIIALYDDSLFEFEVLKETSNMFKFKSGLYDDTPMQVLVCANVKTKIIDMIGNLGCVIISPFGDLYLALDKTMIDKNSYDILRNDCINAVGEYQFLIIDDGLYKPIKI